MNTRTYVEFNQNEEEKICFPELPEEYEILFRRYIEESRHLQEIIQLYQMMLFDLDEIFSHYRLNFDDTVISVNGEVIDMIQVNALLGNAVSAARTLIESMEIFDKVYISKEELFKKNYISKVYDEYFSYRFIDFIRNYMQHGHATSGVRYSKDFHKGGCGQFLDLILNNISGGPECSAKRKKIGQ